MGEQVPRGGEGSFKLISFIPTESHPFILPLLTLSFELDNPGVVCSMHLNSTNLALLEHITFCVLS